jgi:hypothetical protein
MFNELMTRTLKDEKPKTDGEIYKMAYMDWMNTLRQLWTATGKPVNEQQFEVYVKQLADIPFDVLEDVVATLLREHKYNNVPTLGEIWEVITLRHGELDDIKARQSKPWVWRLMGENVEPQLLD